MRGGILVSLVAVLNFACVAALPPALGTAFTYQGCLRDNGQAANGNYDLKFTVFDVPEYGFPVGAVITNAAVPVSGGLFTAELDFGGGVFTNRSRWLEVAVKTNGAGSFITLVPRQPLTPTPQALYAVSTADAELLNGQLSDSFAPAEGSVNYVAKGGDTMTGTLHLPANGLVAGGSQLVLSGDNLGIGTTAPGTKLEVAGTVAGTGLKIGTNHILGGAWATISGGNANKTSLDYAVVGGGGLNTNDGWASTVGGGWYNNIHSSRGGTVSGGAWNGATLDYPTVGGGANNSSSRDYATVGGGYYNTSSGDGATVGGGLVNTSSGAAATVAGGDHNTSSAEGAAVGGGAYNTSSGVRATVGGGVNNLSSGREGTVGGGRYNTNSGLTATVGGGDRNLATNHNATVGGGNLNVAGGDTATVGGGAGNLALGGWSTVPGGRFNAAVSDYSFAAGYRAQAMHKGAFVLADSQESYLSSETDNELLGRFTGGVRFWTSMSVGVRVWPGATSWSVMCDRELKDNFRPVDGKAVLQRLVDMPVQTWNLKAQDAHIRHMGPVAQDFRAAFGVGEDEKYISTSDADGVAMAAIQGLNQKLEERSQAAGDRSQKLEARSQELQAQMKDKVARIEKLEKEMAELRAMVDALLQK